MAVVLLGLMTLLKIFKAVLQVNAFANCCCAFQETNEAVNIYIPTLKILTWDKSHNQKQSGL